MVKTNLRQYNLNRHHVYSSMRNGLFKLIGFIILFLSYLQHTRIMTPVHLDEDTTVSIKLLYRHRVDYSYADVMRKM